MKGGRNRKPADNGLLEKGKNQVSPWTLVTVTQVGAMVAGPELGLPPPTNTL